MFLPGFYRPAKILLDMAKMAKTLTLEIRTKITQKNVYVMCYYFFTVLLRVH